MYYSHLLPRRENALFWEFKAPGIHTGAATVNTIKNNIFSKPNCIMLYITVISSAGGGGGGSTGTNGGGGGGSGGMRSLLVPVSFWPDVTSIAVGAGGAGGASGTNGNNGQPTMIEMLTGIPTYGGTSLHRCIFGVSGGSAGLTNGSGNAAGGTSMEVFGFPLGIVYGLTTLGNSGAAGGVSAGGSSSTMSATVGILGGGGGGGGAGNTIGGSSIGNINIHIPPSLGRVGQKGVNGHTSFYPIFYSTGGAGGGGISGSVGTSGGDGGLAAGGGGGSAGTGTAGAGGNGGSGICWISGLS